MNDKNLCIVVPYRDRESHLREFVPCIGNALSSQGIDFSILIVEQEEGKSFNRAKLLNVGFNYTESSFSNYCFHDVDMLPLASDYSYCDTPTHLAAEVEQFDWGLPYNEYFGGVTIFDRESFQKINGYSNGYWGWGAEDDDVFIRCQEMGITLKRKKCRYRSLHHERVVNPYEYNRNLERLQDFHSNPSTISSRFSQVLSSLPESGKIHNASSVREKMMMDGLNTLEYKILDVKDEPYYKIIRVSI